MVWVLIQKLTHTKIVARSLTSGHEYSMEFSKYVHLNLLENCKKDNVFLVCIMKVINFACSKEFQYFFFFAFQLHPNDVHIVKELKYVKGKKLSVTEICCLLVRHSNPFETLLTLSKGFHTSSELCEVLYFTSLEISNISVKDVQQTLSG